MPADSSFTDERRCKLAQLREAVPSVPGLVSRLLAFVIDMVAMMILCMFLTYLITWTAAFFRLSKLAIGQLMVDFASRGAVILVTLLYFPLSWTLTGQSLGKVMLGVRVVRNDKNHPTVTEMSLPRSCLRAAGYWLSALPFGLGFLWAAFDDEGRTWHDRLAGTRVVYRSGGPPTRRAQRRSSSPA
jgi:uncharacterized RDD family membrane protein YckC